MPMTTKGTLAVTARLLPRTLAIGGACLLFSTALVFYARGAQSTLSEIKQKSTVTVGLANEQPYSYVTPGGEVKGFVADTIAAIFKPAGVAHLKPVVLDFSGLIPGLLAGRFQIIGAGDYITPARCKSVAFSNPVYASGMGFAVRAGNPLHLHSLRDLTANAHARVASESGSAEVADFKTAHVSASQIRLYSTDQETLSALESGRADAVYLPSIELAQLVLTAKRSDLQIATPFQQLIGLNGKPEISYGALAFRKADKDLVEFVDMHLEKLQESGELAQIFKRYGLTPDNVPPTSVTASALCAG